MKHISKTTVVQFFDAWMIKDYAKMYSLTQITWADNNSFEHFVQMVEKWDVKDYTILDGPIKQSKAIHDFMMLISIDHPTIPHKIRLIHEDKPYHANSHSKLLGAVKGRWGINPISLLGLFRPDFDKIEKDLKNENIKKRLKNAQKVIKT